jgi:hypothetical protein
MFEWYETHRGCPVKLQPLSEAELDRVSALLARFGNKRPMNLEQLDGFFAALISGPQIVPPSDYLPVISAAQRQRWGATIRVHADQERNSSNAVASQHCIDTRMFANKRNTHPGSAPLANLVAERASMSERAGLPWRTNLKA